MPDSGWPRIPTRLLLAFLDAVEKARAEDEPRRIARITRAAQGGALVYERTEERVNEKTGAVTRVIEKRFAPPQWTADAWMLERRDPDRWGRKVRFESPEPGAAGGGSGKPPELLDVLTEVWAGLKVSKDPRALPPPTTEATAVKA